MSGSRSKTTRSRRRQVLTLDHDCRMRVFLRDGSTCQRCGRMENVQWCHILGRRHLNLRWEENNSLCLCAGCHLFWHHEPLIAVDWFKTKYRDRWDKIMAVHQVNPKINVKSKYEELKGVSMSKKVVKSKQKKGPDELPKPTNTPEPTTNQPEGISETDKPVENYPEPPGN